MKPKQRQRVRDAVWGERRMPLITTLRRLARLAKYTPRRKGDSAS